MAETTTPENRIPVTILTGFLGAGKTTLLRRILSNAQGMRYAVLINDFGALNIDAELVVERSGDSVALANGCVCCSIRDDLVEAIAGLLASDDAPDRLIIEASGVSRPLAIADALEQDAISPRTVLDGIFCLVDADGFADLDFAATELALDQVAGSDIVILNKVDLAAPATVAKVETTLRGSLPRVRIVHATQANVPGGLLFGPREQKDRESATGHSHHHEHDHDHDHSTEFSSWQWSTDKPLDATRFRRALRQLPTGLLRAKGVLRTDGDSRRLVFHLVGKRVEMAYEDHPAPATSTMVAIGRQDQIDPAALTLLFEGCLAHAPAG